MKRFVDPGLVLNSFANRIWVVCPHCQRPGVITANTALPLHDPHWTTQFSCHHCALKLTTGSFGHLSASRQWHGKWIAYGCESCSQCKKFLRVTRSFNTKPPFFQKQSEIVCDDCGHCNAIDLDYRPSFRIWDGVDPDFGLPLYLKETAAKGTIWVYNETHLAVLKKFVAAGLRERGTTSHATYLMRLPAWIKSSKNRPIVLKLIAKIETRLTTLAH